MNGRTWKWALVGSLVLNAFLLGGITGGAYQWYSTHHEQHARRAVPAGLRFAANGLSADRRQQLLADLQAARREGRPFVRQGRESRGEVLAQLGAPQFDRDALNAALARTRQADEALRAQIESGIVDFVATLSPEERLTFVKDLERNRKWRMAAAAEQRRERRASHREANQDHQGPGSATPDTNSKGEQK